MLKYCLGAKEEDNSQYIGNEQPYICNTYVPLKRLQQSGLTLQDLIEMVNEPLPDDCGCLEPKEQREL